MSKAIKPVVDIPALLEATADLESGHPIEIVLRQHGIPDRWTAYEVVDRYRKNLAHYESATTAFYVDHWAKACRELEPVVKAIEKHLEGPHHA